MIQSIYSHLHSINSVIGLAERKLRGKRVTSNSKAKLRGAAEGAKKTGAKAKGAADKRNKGEWATKLR